MCAIENLQNEHLQLMVLARELYRHLQDNAPPPRLTLFHVRTKLASVLIRHLKTEDWVLYPTMMQSEQRDVRDTAFKLQEQMGSLADAFKQHMECWSALSIENNWDAYKVEAITLLKALERRITLEEADLYPLTQRQPLH